MLTDMSINNDNHKLTLTLFFMIIVILTSRTCCLIVAVINFVGFKTSSSGYWINPTHFMRV